MPRKRFTPAVFDLKPPMGRDRLELRDSESPLWLRITRNGEKSFSIRSRIGRAAYGQPVRMTYPKLARIENLTDARQWARDMVDRLREGHDPRAGQAEREKARQFGTIVRKYLARRVRDEKQNRTAGAVERMFEIYWLPVFERRDTTTIKRPEIIARMDEIYDGRVVADGKAHGGKVACDRALSALRACLNWYALQDPDFINPIVAGMARTSTAKLARDRILKDDEIRALWSVTGKGGIFASIVRLLLLTGQRRDEVALMQYSELTPNGLWTIPAARYKTKRDHELPLSDEALAIVRAQDQLAGSAFVFPGRDPQRAFSGYSASKDRLDAAMLKELRKVSPEAEFPEWRLHDLRRTARSLMSRAGVRPDHAERVLGHVIAGVEGTYDRHAYYAEKRMALDALAALVCRIVNPPAANVFALREAAE